MKSDRDAAWLLVTHDASMDAQNIVIAFFVGLVGFALFVYGKRQSRWPHMLAGVVLMIYPYFVSIPALSAAIGIGVLAALWLLVRFGA